MQSWGTEKEGGTERRRTETVFAHLERGWGLVVSPLSDALEGKQTLTEPGGQAPRNVPLVPPIPRSAASNFMENYKEGSTLAGKHLSKTTD